MVLLEGFLSPRLPGAPHLNLIINSMLPIPIGLLGKIHANLRLVTVNRKPLTLSMVGVSSGKTIMELGEVQGVG